MSWSVLLSILTLPAEAAPINGSIDLASASVTLEGGMTSATSGDQLGKAIASGDINGDGYQDIVLGATGMDMVHVFFGPLTDPYDNVAHADVSFQGEEKGEGGWSVAVGDLNDDGRDDLIVGEPSALDGGGLVTVLAGPLSGGWYDARSPEVLVSFMGFDKSIEPFDWYAGWSLAVGDLDGDQSDDLIVGACGASDIDGDDWPRASGGAFFVSQRDMAYGTTMSLYDATTQIWGFGGTGCSLDTGDTNGDGYDDLLIGSRIAGSSTASLTGAATLVEGRESWPTEIRLANYAPTSLTLRSHPDIYTLLDVSTKQTTGDSVAILDLNGDDYGDIVTGGAASEGSSTLGKVWVVYGAPDATGIDANSSLPQVAAASFGGTISAWVGIDVDSAGDLDGDGSEDLLIGSNKSLGYLFYGLADPSFQVSYSCTALGCTASYPSSPDLSGHQDVSLADATFVGPDANDFAGICLTGVGDVTGDGLLDVAVGGPRQKAYGTTSYGGGMTWVVEGQ